MEAKQLIGIVLVVSTLIIGMSAYVALNMPSINQNNNDTDETTLTTTTTNQENPLIIFRDQDLLEYNITMPDTLMKLVDGRNITISDLKGEWVLIDFFATWCPACEYFNGELKKLVNKWTDNITVIGLTVNMGDTFEKLEEYITEHEITWTLGQDYGEDWENTAADFIGVRYIPTPIVIDPAGRLRYVHEGAWRFVEMEPILQELVSNTPL